MGPQWRTRHKFMPHTHTVMELCTGLATSRVRHPRTPVTVMIVTRCYCSVSTFYVHVSPAVLSRFSHLSPSRLQEVDTIIMLCHFTHKETEMERD